MVITRRCSLRWWSRLRELGFLGLGAMAVVELCSLFMTVTMLVLTFEVHMFQILKRWVFGLN